MLKNRNLDHIGVGTNNIDELVSWYVGKLGFEVVHSCIAPDGTPITFVANNKGIKYELYQPLSGVEPEKDGKADHISYQSENIDDDFQYCVDEGFTITTDGIECIPTAWEKGFKYFKIQGPNDIEVEIGQIL